MIIKPRTHELITINTPISAEMVTTVGIGQGTHDDPCPVYATNRLELVEKVNGSFAVEHDSKIVCTGKIKDGISEDFHLHGFDLYFGSGYEIIVTVQQ